MNPQIINGGQTAYTLSQIYREYDADKRGEVFGDKEVLVKIITFDVDSQLEEQKKLELIDAISRATNSQTVVSKADRRSNEVELKQLQERCFDSFGIWLERKRGEFSDGIREGYIQPHVVVDRNLFIRAAAIARGNLATASMKKVFVTSDFSSYLNAPPEQFARYNLALQVLRWIHEGKGIYRSRLKEDAVCKAYVALLLVTTKTKENEATPEAVQGCVETTRRFWNGFQRYLQRRYPGKGYWWLSKGMVRVFNLRHTLEQRHATSDVAEFFADPKEHMAENESDSSSSSGGGIPVQPPSEAAPVK